MTPPPGHGGTGSYLLPDEPGVPIQRRIAEALGDTKAQLVQSLHFCLSRMGHEFHGMPDDGRAWVQATYADWRDELSWFTVKHIGRSFRELEKLGVVVTIACGGTGAPKWYTLDYARLHEVVAEKSGEFERRPRGVFRRLLILRHQGGAAAGRGRPKPEPKARAARALRPDSSAPPAAPGPVLGEQNVPPSGNILFPLGTAKCPGLGVQNEEAGGPALLSKNNKKNLDNRGDNNRPAGGAHDGTPPAPPDPDRVVVVSLLSSEFGGERFRPRAVEQIAGYPGVCEEVVREAIAEYHGYRRPVPNPCGFIRDAIHRRLDLKREPPRLTGPEHEQELQAAAAIDRSADQACRDADRHLVNRLTAGELAAHVEAAIAAQPHDLLRRAWRQKGIASPTLLATVADRIRTGLSPPPPARDEPTADLPPRMPACPRDLVPGAQAAGAPPQRADTTRPAAWAREGGGAGPPLPEGPPTQPTSTPAAEERSSL